MDVTSNKLLDSLKFRLGQDNLNVTVIDNIIDQIASRRDENSIEGLLLALDDSTNFPEVMYSIVHAAESFPELVYITKYIEALPKLVRSAPEWSSTTMMRILNSPSARAELVRKVRAADEDVKYAIQSVCNLINSASLEFLDRTTAVMIAAQQPGG